jgi:hypothetical protein
VLSTCGLVRSALLAKRDAVRNSAMRGGDDRGLQDRRAVKEDMRPQRRACMRSRPALRLKVAPSSAARYSRPPRSRPGGGGAWVPHGPPHGGSDVALGGDRRTAARPHLWVLTGGSGIA